jgi:hypothetical protein
MSAHEIETLTEASIRVLDRSEGLDHRSMFKNLYDFEGAFDTGFTRLRLMEILIKRRFAIPSREQAIANECVTDSARYGKIHLSTGGTASMKACIIAPSRLRIIWAPNPVVPSLCRGAMTCRPARRYATGILPIMEYSEMTENKRSDLLWDTGKELPEAGNAAISTETAIG